VACKTASGSEPGSYSTTFTGGGSSAGAILQLSNTNCANLAANSGGFTNSATSFTTPSLTTAQANEYVLVLGSWTCSDAPPITLGQVYVSNGTYISGQTVTGYLQLSAGASPTPSAGPTNPGDCGATAIVGQQIAFIPTSTVQSTPLLTNQAGTQVQSLNASVNNVLTVIAPPYNAQGDGNTDDTLAIQTAINNSFGYSANPTGTPLVNATKSVYLPTPSVCYLHSAPIRIYGGNLRFGGDRASPLCQTYSGDAVIQESWGSPGSLPYATSLVTGAGNSLVSASGQASKFIDLARYLNATGNNNLNSKFASAFNIAFFMKPTDFSGDQILSSAPAYPGTGNGAFRFNMGGSNQVTASVNTLAGFHSFAACPAQTASTVYELEMDWDGSTYRVWQGVPGGTAVLCASWTSSSRMTQSPFEEILLPDAGPTQFWLDGSSTQNNAFDGDIDSVRFESASEHPAAYTVPGTKFSNDGSAFLLENFGTSLDGTQTALAGNSPNANVYFTIFGSATIGYVASDNLHDLELCSVSGTQVAGAPQALPLSGLYSSGGNGSLWQNLTCSNSSYLGAEFTEGFYARLDNWNSHGGHLGLNFNSAWNQSVNRNAGIDDTDVACEVYQGAGGGSHEDYSSHCVDRGILRYGWIENQSSGNYYYPAIDQEVSSPNFTANVLLNDPTAPYAFHGGILSPGNGTPGVYVQQDNGGLGASFIGTVFATFGTPPEIVDFTNGSPSTPVQLLNTMNPSGVALSNQAGNPNLLELGVGQTSLMQSLELQQVPKFDAGLAHLTVNPIADPSAATISVVGGTASTSYGPYFVVCHDVNGGVTLPAAASNTVANGPATLSNSNYINIAWSAINGCASWDVLKGSTGLSLALGVTGTSYHDIGGSTSAYTAPVRNTTGDVSGLAEISTGTTFAKLPGTVVNGMRMYCSNCDPPANPPVTCTSSGARTGAFVDGVNNQWLCVP
jgi:hypothetical protein